MSKKLSFYNLLTRPMRRLLAPRESKQAQQLAETKAALSRSEARYRAMLEDEAEMVCRFRPDGRILSVNGACARRLGLSSEALEGRSFWDFVAPDDRPQSKYLLDELRPEQPSLHIENRFGSFASSSGSMGDFCWTLWTIHGLEFDDRGRPAELQSVGMDISDRKQAEQSLREREEQLRLALEGANAGAWSRDLVVGRTFWSQEFLSLYGFGEVGPDRFRDWIARVHPDDRQWVQEAFWGRAESGASKYQQEFRIIHPERGERWILALGRVERNSDGKAVRVSGINIDITERKAVEHALRDSEERFRTLADNMSQLAWMADPDGWIFWYNRRWYDFTGTTLEDVQGWGWTKVLKPDQVEAGIRQAHEFWRTGKEWEQMLLIRGRNAEYRWFLVRVTPIYGEDGRLLRWFGTNTDITEQRAAEQALKDADRRKDEFLATLAHELRNPLAPLRNCLETMRLASDDPDVVTEARAVMDRQLDNMVHLINDLLDLSRISRGKITLRKAPVWIVSVIQQAVETCQPTLDAAGHRLNISTPEQAVYVNADPARLAQVFSNLLSNAAKFTPEHGQIWLTVEHEGEDLITRIRDTGAGIEPNLLGSVFDMFTQGDTSDQQGGLGIGLSLVKGIVELHGGSVEAHSEGIGKGSEFVIRLPAAEADKHGPEPTDNRHMPIAVSSRRILVVDDNRDAATSMAKMLELLGHETRTAHDGLAAIEAAAAFRPEIILLDIGMPKLNGYEAARRIREQDWGRKILLVALTGWGQEEDRKRSREAGFDFHLVKPVELASLQALISDGVERREQ